MQNQSSNYGLSIFKFIIGSFIFGAILRELSKRKTFPYAPILLLIGAILGYFQGDLGTLGEPINLAQYLNLKLVLLVLIPALVFDSAFNCKWYIFRKSFINILTLALPGVLLSAMLIAFSLKIILAYSETDFGWVQALALGCVLSPIDPVATTNLLKKIGAKERFNTFLEGEALINDGTSMVFFYYFISLVNKDQIFHESVLTMAIKSIGGPVLGIVFGMVICFCIKRIVRDKILSITVSVVGVYACFYFCEQKLNFSGILGVIVLGLYVCGVCKRKFSPETVQILHTFWSFLQQNCQVLIFMIVGFVEGLAIVQGLTITLFDWIRLFIFWFLMIAIRAIMILASYPILKRSGYGITKKEIVILIYGGTRGAICLVMAFVISIDLGFSQRYRQLVLFYACGMTILTKVINGLTCQKLVNNIEKTKAPSIKNKFFQKCVKEVLGEAHQKLSQLKQQPNVAYAEWKDVEKLAGVKVLGSTSSEFIERSLISEDIFSGNSQIIEQIRFRLTRYLHRVYWKMHENGELSESSLAILSQNCDIVDDTLSSKLNYFDLLSRNFAIGSMKYYFRFKDTPFIGPLFIHLLINKVYDAYEITDAFVEACEEAIQLFQNNLPHTEQLSYVLGQLKDNMEQGMLYIYELEDSYPTVTRAVHTLKASTTLLKQKKRKLQEMFGQGFVDNKAYDELQAEIETQISKVQTHKFELSNIKFNQVLTVCPLFSNLPIHEIVNIRMKSIEQTFTKGTILQSKNQTNKYVYFIITGSVREQFDTFYFMKSIGSVVDPYDFIYQEQSKANVRTVNETKIMKIEAKFIFELLQKYPEFKKRWYKSIFNYTLKLSAIPKGNNLIESLRPKQKRRFIQKSTVTFLNSQQEYAFPFGCCILQGEIKFELTTLIRGDLIFKPMIIRTETQGIVLQFPKVDWKEIEGERICNTHDLFET